MKNLKGCNNMAKYTLPDFVAHTHGQCEICFTDDVDLFVIPDYLLVCKYCLENNVDICSECGKIWASDAVEFTFTDDGRMICEYCMEELDLE